ncbi:hypothetical protein SLEP1_g48442 [Rubroshorea leprosula]|uniref:Uncharacterized protein n=1 Tax=Rubroshorea leprosula TaxID=152421 RepID=A0AAV5LWM6_9ROSI|nr:hypothetical protein SLEP1_g48442 [Rubroshorea leprosula]
MKTCTRVPSYENMRDSNTTRLLEKSIISFSFINMNDMSPVELERHKQEPAEQIPILIHDLDSPPHDHRQYQHQLQQAEREGEEEEGKEPTYHLELLRRRLIEKEASKTSSIMDITFCPNFCMATLKLPPIEVDNHTVPNLMNLMAQEMCPDFMSDFEITSYVSFLNSLIEKAVNVKELRDAGVLCNRLGSDKTVVRLFNKINTKLVPNPEQYKELKHRIQEHSNTAWTTNMTQLYYTCFNSRTWPSLVRYSILV